MPSGFVRKSASPGARSGLRPDRVRVDRADDRESVLRLRVADRVPAREDRARGAHPLVRAGEDVAEHLDRKLLGKRCDREREQRRATHREDVVQRIRGRDRAEGARVVDEGREEVDGEDERALVVEAIDRRVVRGVEADEQVFGLGGDEPGEQRLEARGRVLRGATARPGERSQRTVSTRESRRGEEPSRGGEIGARRETPLLLSPEQRPPPPRRPLVWDTRAR